MSPSRRRVLRIVRRALLALGAVVVVVGLTGLLLYHFTLAPVGAGKPQLVEIRKGQSAAVVGQELERKGVIRSARAFALLARWTGKGAHLQIGGYRLSPKLGPREILEALAAGKYRTWRWLTIPEGYTLRRMAERIGEEGLTQPEAFLQAARPAAVSAGFPLPDGSLEGYLFPDTYRVDPEPAARDIVAQMLRRFRDVVWQRMFEGKATYRGRSMAEIVTLASCVEAEAKRDAERPIIAGVLMNRLRTGMKLQCDATVQYALGAGRKTRLLNKDLLVDSEYNTYLHAGLPPGPICSPGAASIRAAMNPASVPYLYYVARPDGSHVFSRTFAEHQAAIAQLRRK